MRFFGLALLAAACAQPSAVGVPAAAKSAPAVPTVPVASTAPAVATRPAPEPGWAARIRTEDWGEAARLLDVEGVTKSSPAEVRFARARVARRLADNERCRTLLEGLEVELPVLASTIAAERAECSVETGPPEDVVKSFERLGTTDGLVKAARALERAGKLLDAKKLLDRALARPKPRDAEVLAHSARARVAAALKDRVTAALDLRWLAVEAPVSPEARDIEARLAGIAPPVVLTTEERKKRALAFAEAWRLEDALRELEHMSKAPGPRITGGEALHVRAWCHYLSRDDEKAVALLDQSSQLSAEHREKDAYYAARALARRGDDAGAAERLEAFVKKYPRSGFAEEARYRAARLRLMAGQWDEALRNYKVYLAGRGKKFADAARFETSLAELGAGRWSDAEKSLARLVADADGETERARLRQLRGAALSKLGRRDEAVAELLAVVRDRPLSFSALAGAARLSDLGEAPPGLGPLSVDVAEPLDVEIPEKAALLARLGFVRDAEKEIAAHEAELVGRYAPRGHEALCRAYGNIGVAAERYRLARRVVRPETLKHAPTSSTRWAWDCLYPAPHSEAVQDLEASLGLPPGLLHAVMRQESAFKHEAVSSARAVGLLQLLPSTAERVAEENGLLHEASWLTRPSHNVALGARYLRKVIDTFGGELALGAAAYNAGPRAVSRWLETGEGLPLDVWVARIPYGETRHYVEAVIGNFAVYSYLRGGDEAVPKLSLALPQGFRAGDGAY